MTSCEISTRLHNRSDMVCLAYDRASSGFLEEYGVWKYGDVDIWGMEEWRCGIMETWKYGNVKVWGMEEWRCGIMETWKYGNVNVWGMEEWRRGSVEEWICGSMGYRRMEMWKYGAWVYGNEPLTYPAVVCEDMCQ